MDVVTPFLIAFAFVFLSELGDKTQLLVLSFSTKLKTLTLIIGIALGSLFSHGVAILFGSTIGSIAESNVKYIIQIVTFLSFILIGLYILFLKKEEKEDNTGSLKFLSNLKINYIFIIAISIAVGELGDKTFLASIGLGVNYPGFKISLILGAILGMVISDCIAIFLGKLLSKKLNTNAISKLSGLLFLIFGIMGFIFL